jgi:hypothetical protein
MAYPKEDAQFFELHIDLLEDGTTFFGINSLCDQLDDIQTMDSDPVGEGETLRFGQAITGGQDPIQVLAPLDKKRVIIILASHRQKSLLSSQ